MESVQFYSLKIRFTKKSEQQKCSDLNVNHCSVLIVNQHIIHPQKYINNVELNHYIDMKINMYIRQKKQKASLLA